MTLRFNLFRLFFDYISNFFSFFTSLQGNFNPGKNIWNKVKKSSKIGPNHKTLIIAPEGFLTALQKFYFWNEGSI